MVVRSRSWKPASRSASGLARSIDRRYSDRAAPTAEVLLNWLTNRSRSRVALLVSRCLISCACAASAGLPAAPCCFSQASTAASSAFFWPAASMRLKPSSWPT
ncbi:hypothetical protein D3C71_1365670 [compost metagenome]